MDHEKTQQKKFICVQVKVDEKYFYLFDSQRRKRDSKTAEASDYIDRLPILLVWKSGFLRLLPNDFISMIKTTVENQTWPNSIIDHNRDFTVHGAGAKSSEDMTIRVAQLILRNQG